MTSIVISGAAAAAAASVAAQAAAAANPQICISHHRINSEPINRWMDNVTIVEVDECTGARGEPYQAVELSSFAFCVILAGFLLAIGAAIILGKSRAIT